MAQAKAIYTKVGVDPVALWFHAEVLRALPGFRAIWRCEPTLLQDRESEAATPRKSGRLIASASRRSSSGTSCHTPGCRRPFSAGHGNRCLRSAGSAATNATPGRLESTIQDSPGAHCRQRLRGTGWRRPGAAATPPRVDPLDHNGSCNGTSCEPVGGATMLPPPAGRAP